MNTGRPAPGAPAPTTGAGSAMWRAVRKFASGVAVATTGSGGTVHGATVSAFTFVSWQPPLVSICVRHGSSLLDRLREHRAFAVNVLGREQTRLARHFADRCRPAGSAQFEGVPWVPAAETGVPLLLGAVSWLVCHAVREIAMGDHQFVLAEVATATTGEGVPLLYFDGRLFAGVLTEQERQP